MNTEALKRGAVGGMIGGIVMAMWSMIVLAVTGSEFWTPLNLIAHTMWRQAPLGATFSVGALVIGLVVWLIMQYGIWKVVDPDAARAFTPWVFAVGHLMFGAVAALAVGMRAVTRRTTAPGLSA